jgi:hypothetical protein
MVPILFISHSKVLGCDIRPKDNIILDEDMLVDYTQDVFGDKN